MSMYNKIIDKQKLKAAWQRVRKNKPAAGVDNVTFEQFDDELDEQIGVLHGELKEHHYSALPVKGIMLYKGEKARTIALYSMRDKVVQQSLATELNRIYDGEFSAWTYAYRTNKSALAAINEIHEKIVEGKLSTFIRLDIHDFFGSIIWRQLEQILRLHIIEDDVVDLIRQNACGLSLDEMTGELLEKSCGIYQGSAVAPILSNIYMMSFDHWLSAMEDIFYVRYSDDMVLLGKENDRMVSLLQEITRRLEVMGLSLNEEKSVVGKVMDGIFFLGYYFDEKGKCIPKKAESNLQERLEMLWLTSSDIGVEDKLKKVLEIVGGWEQYFRDERKIGSIFEYAALLFSGGMDDVDELLRERAAHKNNFRDLTDFFVSEWKKRGYDVYEVFEYEQLYGIPMCNDELKVTVVDEATRELLQVYRRYHALPTAECAVELMQIYSDRKDYVNAQYWQERSEALQSSEDRLFDAMLTIEKNGEGDIIYRAGTLRKFLKTFAGREDVYAQEMIDYRKQRKCEVILLPLTEKQIKEHLRGAATYDTYIRRPNDTIRFLVFDIDVSKNVLLRVDRKAEEFSGYLQRALDRTVEIRKWLHQYGIESYVEYSGYRGYHLWVIFSEWLPMRYGVMLMELVEKAFDRGDNISMEYFPKKAKLKPGKYGQRVKLPYGRHPRSGERSFFLGNDGSPILKVDLLLDSIAKASCNDVKKVLALANKEEEIIGTAEVDKDISAYEDISEGVREVLMHCNLMRHLALKSVKIGYLSHFERLSILYVFGHLGEDGKRFVHSVMRFTLNYRYDVTQRFIDKMPGKPVSCVKLRDQYKKITAEFGCSCSFGQTKNCYPSPVLHAAASTKKMDVDVTLPMSRTITKAKEKKIIREINPRLQVDEKAKKLLELRKQLRNITNALQRAEKDLCTIYDEQNTDAIEIEIGILVRKKTEQGYDWMIEI